MAILYTSDLHLGHQNILVTCGREKFFSSIEEMNEVLIRKWNEKVNPSDDVYILGDLSFRAPVHISTFLNQMIGHKHLVIGNHDITWLKNVPDTSLYFESIDHMTLIKEGKNLITLCHYPMLEWNRSRHAQVQEGSTSWLIHGHIHNSTTLDAYHYIKENLPCALNAGVDINHFEPVTFNELLDNNNKWYGRVE